MPGEPQAALPTASRRPASPTPAGDNGPMSAPLIEVSHLRKRYGESVVYQALAENVACEMASRMVAMKSASDNAGALIDELQLIYNKARQASITQELAEIVGGAAAV